MYSIENSSKFKSIRDAYSIRWGFSTLLASD